MCFVSVSNVAKPIAQYTEISQTKHRTSNRNKCPHCTQHQLSYSV